MTISKNIIIVKRKWDSESTLLCLNEVLDFYTSINHEKVKYRVHLQSILKDHEIVLKYKEHYDKRLEFIDTYDTVQYDLGVVIGGDGTLLYANMIMNKIKMPPILCFDAGTLGFLCEHQIDSTKARIEEIHQDFLYNIEFTT